MGTLVSLRGIWNATCAVEQVFGQAPDCAGELVETPDVVGEEGSPESSGSESVVVSARAAKAWVDNLGHMVVGTGQDQPGALGEEPLLSFPFF
jgi:hypothetical protein